MRPGIWWRVAAGVAGLVGMTCSAAHGQTSPKYGALAIDRTNGFYFGFAVDYDSAAEAEKRAVEEGNKRGGDTSVVLLWSGEGCGAYRSVNPDAGDGSAYGWAVAATRPQAEARAMREAQKRSKGQATPNHAWACNSRTTAPLEILKDEANAPQGEDIVLKNVRRVSEVAVSPDGDLVATLSSGDGKVMIWDARTGALLRSLDGLTSSPNSIAFAPDGRLAGTDNARVVIWNPRTGAQLGETANDELLHDIAFTADGRLLRAHGAQESYDPGGGWMIYSFGPDASPAGKLTLVGLETHGYYDTAFSPNGRLIVTAGDKDGEELKIWDADSGQLKRKFAAFNPVYSVTYSPDGRHLAITGTGVEIRDGVSGARIRQFGAGTVYDAAFSADGARLATAHRDGSVRVWDVATGRQIHSMSGHTALAQTVAFSPDGRMVVSGSEDGTARLWDATTGQPMKAPEKPAVRPAAARPSPSAKPAAGKAADAAADAADAAAARKAQADRAAAEQEAKRQKAAAERAAAEQAATDRLNQQILARDAQIKAANEAAAAEAAARQEAFKAAMSDYEQAKAKNDAEVAAADAARRKYEADAAEAAAAKAKYDADMRAYQETLKALPTQ